ncbi:MAG: DUF58 domain-containing protein [Bdellovibrionota bacterium]
MLSSELITQIKRLQLKAGHLANDALAGEYSSVFKGLGMEFDEVREYVPGDDIRIIDWNVTARAYVPHIKKFREEREMTMMLLVDVSPSQGFGTTGRFKNEVSAELAAILAFLAIKNNDKVGLIAFSDHVEQYIPPNKGRAHVWRIIREVLTHEGRGKKTDIAGALDYLMKVQQRKSMCFMLSDFWSDGYETSLRIAAKRHSITCVRVEDPRERELSPCGLIEFEDQESGERIIIDSQDRKVRESFCRAWNSRAEKLTEQFRRFGIASFAVETGEPVIAPLMQFMRKRERRIKI